MRQDTHTRGQDASGEQIWSGRARIAYCPDHGLHGERKRCFVCDWAVTQIEMMPVAEHERLREAAEALVKEIEASWVWTPDVAKNFDALRAALAASEHGEQA